MKVMETKLAGVWLIDVDVFADERGYFLESYHQAKFAEYGIHPKFIQDNHSLSAMSGTLRGLHFQQAPKAQTKLVRVIAGAIYDVVVDIRQDSPTCGQWVGVILSADNHRQMLVPKGCAHGFCTTEPDTHVVYKVDEYYSPEHDRGLRWDDPDLGIDWPCVEPILSAKDQAHPAFIDIWK